MRSLRIGLLACRFSLTAVTLRDKNSCEGRIIEAEPSPGRPSSESINSSGSRNDWPSFHIDPFCTVRTAWFFAKSPDFQHGALQDERHRTAGQTLQPWLPNMLLSKIDFAFTGTFNPFVLFVFSVNEIKFLIRTAHLHNLRTVSNPDRRNSSAVFAPRFFSLDFCHFARIPMPLCLTTLRKELNLLIRSKNPGVNCLFIFSIRCECPARLYFNG